MAKKEKQKTKVFFGDYRGTATFEVWPVDENGEKVGEYFLVSFGAKKAKAIIEHVDELTEWVDEGCPNN